MLSADEEQKEYPSKDLKLLPRSFNEARIRIVEINHRTTSIEERTASEEEGEKEEGVKTKCLREGRSYSYPDIAKRVRRQYQSRPQMIDSNRGLGPLTSFLCWLEVRGGWQSTCTMLQEGGRSDDFRLWD